MALASAQVVAGIVGALNATFAVSAMQVLEGKNLPFDQADLDCFRVGKASEDITQETVHLPWINLHELTVSVEAIVRDLGDLDARMDAATEQALTALFSTETAATLAPLTGVQMQLQSIDYSTSAQADFTIGVATISLLVRFRTYSNNPSQLI